MPDISLGAGRAYFRSPEGHGPWPGVVVLHDVFGLTADTRRQADWLAAAGYLAIAPDLYGRRFRLAAVRAAYKDTGRRSGATFDRIEAARRTLTARPDCTGKVAVFGYSMGGVYAQLCAANRGFAVASVNYGFVPRDAEALLKDACPVVGSFGGRDYTLRGDSSRLEQALQRNGIEHDVKEYPDAEHSFFNDHQGVLRWVMKLVRMRPDQPSAADARARNLRFFDRHLRAGSGVAQ